MLLLNESFHIENICSVLIGHNPAFQDLLRTHYPKPNVYLLHSDSHPKTEFGAHVKKWLNRCDTEYEQIRGSWL